ncbi:MAG: 2-phosphosulfolactate phosphatase [Candidatus Njordarchaeia archaeon]
MSKVFCVTHFTDDLGETIRGKIAVVFDVFRASTTIVAALYRGFKYVIPVYDIEEGLEIAKKYDAVTAGEDGGRKIKEYDFSNSPYQMLKRAEPRDYLVLRSSNGTRVIKGLDESNIVLIGALINAKNVADSVKKIVDQTGKDVYLIAAGKKGRRGVGKTMEDILGVALVAKYLKEKGLELDSTCEKMIKYNKYLPILKFLLSKIIFRALSLFPSDFLKDMYIVSKIDKIQITPILDREKNAIKIMES